MLRILAIGLLASLFFSSTFILNRAMSLGGGHWFWTAALRYGYMLLFLCSGLLLSGRTATLLALLRLFRANWRFWTLAGSIGFGLFYSLLSFSASHAPGWVVATTWQLTILAGPLVLVLFGHRVPIKAVFLVAVIFAGVLLVNLAQVLETSLGQVLLGALPALGAAFAYPCGNQLVWEAQRGRHPRLPHIDNPLLEHAIYRMLLMTLGTLPFWLLLFVCAQPPAPTPGQWLQTAMVGLCSGVVATSLFLHARHLAEDAYQISAIDATQAGEVVFSLLGEVLLLGAALPGPLGWFGVGLTLFGLVLYLQRQSPAKPVVQ
jgi:drug/metabolite transporter (DMT)-like permease